MRIGWVAIGIVAAIALSACSVLGGPNTITPAPHGPAFEMIILHRTPCANGVSATACLKVRVTNRGDRAGSGFCRPRAFETGENGTVTLWGQRLELTNVAPGEQVTATLPWKGQLPTRPN